MSIAPPPDGGTWSKLIAAVDGFCKGSCCIAPDAPSASIYSTSTAKRSHLPSSIISRNCAFGLFLHDLLRSFLAGFPEPPTALVHNLCGDLIQAVTARQPHKRFSVFSAEMPNVGVRVAGPADGEQDDHNVWPGDKRLKCGDRLVVF